MIDQIVQAHNTDIKEIWDIKTLLLQLPRLRAVIDLTNTNRYYDPQELKSAGVLHKKILMPGRIIPPEDKVTDVVLAPFVGHVINLSGCVGGGLRDRTIVQHTLDSIEPGHIGFKTSAHIRNLNGICCRSGVSTDVSTVTRTNISLLML
ncbi:unnamed protein product [Pieris macdunnoughi]|uniref:Uncharacterized protein n=1 Tax=Pieris macdunnoughi TaxID=345717 RepID=A0A821Y1X5_9NEOP|nr:unnamed protein product [Pieris macdunnoughi]